MNARNNRLRLVFIFLMLLTPLLSTHTSLSQDAAPACPMLVRQVLDDARARCEGAGRNQACYGHTRLDAQPQPHVLQFNFDEEGDITDIPNILTMRLSAMQPDSDVWGVALMRIRANVINYAGRQDATMILFGGVEITNGVAPVVTTTELTIHTPGGDARIRNAPWGGTISAVSDGDTVTANGRLANSSWVRIVLPEAPDRDGWIHGSLIENRAALEVLEVVDRNSALFAPMQAFYFQSGQDDASCDEVPNSGLLIQTPEGQGRIVFLINEVAVDLGSTVYFQATPGRDMSIAVVEGSVHVQTASESAYATAGSQIDVPLTSAGTPAGPLSLPKAYDPGKVKALPVEQLDRPVKVHPPLSDDELDDLHDIQDEMAETTVITEIMAPEPAPEEAIVPEGDPISEEESDTLLDEQEGEAETDEDGDTLGAETGDDTTEEGGTVTPEASTETGEDTGGATGGEAVDSTVGAPMEPPATAEDVSGGATGEPEPSATAPAVESEAWGPSSDQTVVEPTPTPTPTPARQRQHPHRRQHDSSPIGH